MTLSKLTAFSCEQGDAKLREDEIQFQSADNDWGSDKMKISKPEPCKRSFFVSLPPGFHTEFRFADREQTIVCLSGKYRIATPEGAFFEKSAGSLMHLERGEVSTHDFEVLGDESAYFMIVQVD